jgi:hypothetical protein
MPIEATILAYQGLQSDADGIAAAIAPTLDRRQPSKIVIASPTDVAAILQLRVILFQTSTLTDRLEELRRSLYKLHCKAPVPPTHGTRKNFVNVAPVLSLFSSPSDISTMLTTAANLSATTEAVSAQSGNFLDVTLISLVAESLRITNPNLIFVYVPSLVPPNFTVVPVGDFADSERTHSYLYTGLRDLEKKRAALQHEAAVVLAKCAKDDPDGVRMTKLVIAAVAAADSYEGSLLGTPLVIPSTDLLAAPEKPATPSPKPPGGKPSSIENTIVVNQPSPPATSATASAATSTPLQQILYADLLLHELGSSEPSSGVLKDVYLLSVHALESGGTQLTKTQLFLGARVFFSGGAVAAFTLVEYNGSILCSGISAGYRGYIKADDFGLAVKPVAENAPAAVVPNTQDALPSGRLYPPKCSR